MSNENDLKRGYKFVPIGRHQAINAFHSLRSLREQKNALYLEADGGLGKTKLLIEYIRECTKQRRPWHVCPPEVNATPDSSDAELANLVIDFADFQNRTVVGLRRSIVRRIGKDFFSEFEEVDYKLREAELSPRTDGAKAKAVITSLQLAVEQAFFRDFKRALREVKNYTAIFFDTFEIAYNRDVGRWFLKDFLPNPATTGCLVVFAGRPSEFELPLNVNRHTVGPFKDVDAAEYFNKKWRLPLGPVELQLLEKSQGRPLMIDLLTHFLSAFPQRVQTLLSQSADEVEKAIAAPYFTPDKVEYDVIQEMGYLKRRYNRAIYDVLHSSQPNFPMYEVVRDNLRELPFVKYRHADDSLALHDEFQRMIEECGGREWTKATKDWYERIVQHWYDTAIREAQGDVERALLRGEQLAYILEDDRTVGLLRYRNYFEGVKAQPDFELNDLLWGEVSDLLLKQIKKEPEDLQIAGQAYTMTREQANWLYENSQYSAATDLFERTTTGNDFQNARDATLVANDKMRLGDCYQRVGEVDEAQRVYTSGLEVAEQSNDIIHQAWFKYNLGHIYARRGKWREAIGAYESAFDRARDSQHLDLMSQALFVMARLRARQGEYQKAVEESKRSVQLSEKLEPVRQVQAFIYAGDIYRYGGDVASAENHYRRADAILKSIGGWQIWQAQAFAGIGAAYNLAGVQKRMTVSDLLGDISDQQNAFKLLSQSLALVDEYRLESYRAVVFDRMADVYLEAAQIQTFASRSPDPDVEGELLKLQRHLEGLDLSHQEKEWGYGLRDAGVSFRSLDNLARVQRLFEVAFLQSSRMNDPHHMLDAVAGAAGVAQLRGRKPDLDYYSTLVGVLHGVDDPDQEQMLLAGIDVLRGHLEFDNRHEVAIGLYKDPMAVLAQKGGFGWMLAQKQLPEIEKRLLRLPKESAREYCKELAAAWQEYPALLSFIQRVEDVLLFS